MLSDAQAAAPNAWIELAEATEESAIADLCKLGELPDDASLGLTLAADLIESLHNERQDPLRSLNDELLGNIVLSTEEGDNQVNTSAQDQDQEVLNHQAKVRERMAQNYSNQHEIEVFRVDQIVTLKLPVEDRSALDNKRIFCKVVSVPVESKYKLQCEYGIISNLYPTRQLNKVGAMLEEGMLALSSN